MIEGGFEDNLNVVNTSGTLNRLTISGTTFGFNSAAGGNNNIMIDVAERGHDAELHAEVVAHQGLAHRLAECQRELEFDDGRGDRRTAGG